MIPIQVAPEKLATAGIAAADHESSDRVRHHCYREFCHVPLTFKLWLQIASKWANLSSRRRRYRLSLTLLVQLVIIMASSHRPRRRNSTVELRRVGVRRCEQDKIISNVFRLPQTVARFNSRSQTRLNSTGGANWPLSLFTSVWAFAGADVVMRGVTADAVQVTSRWTRVCRAPTRRTWSPRCVSGCVRRASRCESTR